jgi:hypothetical protein
LLLLSYLTQDHIKTCLGWLIPAQLFYFIKN